MEVVFVLQGRRQLALPSTQLIAAPGWLAAWPTLGPGTKPCPEVGGQRGRGPAQRSPFESLGPPPHLPTSPLPGSVQFPPGPAPASPALAGGRGGAVAFRGGGRTRRSGWGSVRMRRRGPEKQAGAADMGAGSTGKAGCRAEEGRGPRLQGKRGCGDAQEKEGAGRPGGRRGARGWAGTRAEAPPQDLGRGAGERGLRAGAESRVPVAGLWLHRVSDSAFSEIGPGGWGWRGGRGGRTSLNRPGNSRGVGPANWGAAPHPLPSPPSGIFL